MIKLISVEEFNSICHEAHEIDDSLCVFKMIYEFAIRCQIIRIDGNKILIKRTVRIANEQDSELAAHEFEELRFARKDYLLSDSLHEALMLADCDPVEYVKAA